METTIEKEKKIIEGIIKDSQEELITILEEFEKNQNEFNAKQETASDIIEYFNKIIFRLNRFNEFKSKFKALSRGEKISKKELERCNFVIKFGNDNVHIMKNSINDIKGKFIKK